MTVTIHFHGASGTVTGSCYRVVHPKGQFLVDCGMFQGNKTVRDLNYKPLPFDPKAIDFLLLTHAHIDHAGLLPKLTKNGYRNVIWCTEPTGGLLEYLLPDAAGIQESEAEFETRKRGRKGNAPLEPLYQMRDAEQALKLRKPVTYEQWIDPGPGVRARYWNAGHILGSASIEVNVEDEATGLQNTPFILFCILEALGAVERHRVKARHLQYARDPPQDRRIVVDDDDLVVWQNARPRNLLPTYELGPDWFQFLLASRTMCPELRAAAINERFHPLHSPP